MNTKTVRAHPTATRATRVAAASLLALAALGAATGPSIAARDGGSAGAIWTTNAPCTAPAPQNQNEYAAGDTVYIRGGNFDPSAAVDWAITGQPGGASTDPQTTVASGSTTTDADGGFCVAAYVVEADDLGEYTVDVTQDRARKNDNYTVSTTGPGTTGPGTTDPGTTDPGTTDPGTTDPGTTDPGTTDPGTTDPGTTDGSTPPFQSVLGVVGVGPELTLPETDAAVEIESRTTSLPALVLGLAAIAGLAVLIAPSRRRKPDATE